MAPECSTGRCFYRKIAKYSRVVARKWKTLPQSGNEHLFGDSMMWEGSLKRGPRRPSATLLQQSVWLGWALSVTLVLPDEVSSWGLASTMVYLLVGCNMIRELGGGRSVKAEHRAERGSDWAVPRKVHTSPAPNALMSQPHLWPRAMETMVQW